VLDDDLLDLSKLENKDGDRFKGGRTGDHLMCPFQCDECQFQNVQRRNPLMGNEKDQLLIICIRRAILDSFWSREPSTVIKNLYEGMKGHLLGQRLGIETHPQGQYYPMQDNWGMGIACMTLIRSLDPGKSAAHVQFSTIRKLRTHFSNYYHTLFGGVGINLAGDDGAPRFVTNSPTNTFWYRRFQLGCHKRMGDVWIPDRALTIDELLASLKLLEEDWTKVKDLPADKRLKVALQGVLFSSGFASGLRGEELPRIEIGPILRHWGESVHHPRICHVPLFLQGRFKRTIGEKMFVQPLAYKTRSGIPIGLWMLRALRVYQEMNIHSGPMFRRSGGKARARIADLDFLFWDVLVRVQNKYPNIIAPTVNVHDEFSTMRSLRRGVTSHAQNCKIRREVIETNNRWRKFDRARGMTPGMSMFERYSDARANLEFLVEFSQAL
jgi:hypothetical protein